MHKTWFECRRPTADELWISKYHGTQSYKPTDTKDIMRSVLTLQTMRNQLSALATPGEKNIQDEIEHRFPDYAEQLKSMAGELRRMGLSIAGPRSSPTVDETIPMATRDTINSMVVNAKSASGNDKVAGYANAKEDIRNAVFLSEALPHLADIGGIVDKYLGATERNVRALFKTAQENAPSVIFIDEVDALFSVRETRHEEASTQHLKSEFLTVLTMYTKFVVIGATNLPWALDSAFLRRFNRHIHIGLPSLAERVGILKLKLHNSLHELTDVDLDELAENSDGFTGNTIRQAVTQEWNAMYKKIESAAHFRKAPLNGREVYCPCPDSHPEARTVSFGSISDRLYPQPITKDGLLSAMKSLQRTVAMTKAGDEKHVRWSHGMFHEL